MSGATAGRLFSASRPLADVRDDKEFRSQCEHISYRNSHSHWQQLPRLASGGYTDATVEDDVIKFTEIIKMTRPEAERLKIFGSEFLSCFAAAPDLNFVLHFL